MAVAPAGIYSLPLLYLENTIAASVAFQGYVGAANETEAKDSVFYVATSSTTFPMVVIDFAESLSWRRAARGSRDLMDQEGELVALYRDDDRTALALLVRVDAIIDDMLEISGTAGYLDISTLRVEQQPQEPKRAEEESVGQFSEAMLIVTYRSMV